MSNCKVLMPFPSVEREALPYGQRDASSNTFAMVSSTVKTTSFQDSFTSDTDENKQFIEVYSERNGGLPRNGLVRAMFQLSQDPDGVTEVSYNPYSFTNVLRQKGFGYVLQGRLSPEHAWAQTEIILEALHPSSAVSGTLAPETIMKQVTVYPEMRLRVVSHSRDIGGLRWLYGLGQSQPLEDIIKACIIF